MKTSLAGKNEHFTLQRPRLLWIGNRWPGFVVSVQHGDNYSRSLDAECPLDWSSVGISISEEHNGSEIAHSEDDMESDYENEEGSEEENLENSYFNWDIADWDVQCARDRSLTLPMEQVELVD